jgi:precorrin-2 dehydrogenase/sirohydrochlorin ferrochelatase
MVTYGYRLYLLYGYQALQNSYKHTPLSPEVAKLKLPIFVDVDGMKVLVIGGGDEGYKKARRFLEAGAEVTVVSKKFLPDLIELARRSERLRLVEGDASDRLLLERAIEGCDIVISALGDAREIDSIIIDIARKHRKLYILAGDALRTQCGMGIGGVSGDIRFAVYTDGRSSLVAMEARDRIARFLDSQRDLHIMLKLLSSMKRILRSIGVPSDMRIEIHREVFRDNIFRSLASSGDEEGAWNRICEIVQSRSGIDLRRAVEIYGRV